MSARPSIPRPAALLVVADFHGTLASVRSLGRAGVAVSVADWRRLVPARWSRFATRTLTCPDPTVDPRGFLGWLFELGLREPGLVLIPTTDDLAWLFARYRSTLARHFIVDAPPLSAVYGLLNKWRLRDACAAVGLLTPQTWLPETLDPAAVTFPLIIKPQTQTLMFPHQKGRVVRLPSQLQQLYDEFRTATCHASALVEIDPQVSQPLLQALVSSRGIYSLSGFIDATGELFVVSAARKVLQRPQVLGVGLCFQKAAVNLRLADKLRALCRHLGYHGLFEVEFLEDRDRHLLIDFNPRAYGQMGFDVARGANLPLMAYLSAVGDRAELRDVVAEAQRALAVDAPQAWCDRIALELSLKLWRMSGNLSRAAARNWSQWLAVHEPHLTDAVVDRDDWLPGVIAAASTFWQHASHPRATWRAAREA